MRWRAYGRALGGIAFDPQPVGKIRSADQRKRRRSFEMQRGRLKAMTPGFANALIVQWAGFFAAREVEIAGNPYKPPASITEPGELILLRR
jgi:hypothetical protein